MAGQIPGIAGSPTLTCCAAFISRIESWCGYAGGRICAAALTFALSKGIPMGLGLGILLMAVGAVLYFAVDATISGVDIDVVGIILMVAGAMTLILGLVMNAQRSNTTVTQRRQDVRRPPFDE